MLLGDNGQAQHACLLVLHGHCYSWACTCSCVMLRKVLPGSATCCLSRACACSFTADQSVLTVQSLQWEPGGKGAAHQLQRFLNDSLPGFSFNRAKTDRESTSRLSPHMHIGELSCRVLYHTVVPLLMCRLPILQENGHEGTCSCS